MKRLMNKVVKKTVSFVLSLAMVVSVCPQTQLIDVSAAEDDTPYCVSYGRPAYASSEKGNSTADKAVDGDIKTDWESNWEAGSDRDKISWLYVDLGKETTITGYHILWENAYAKSYQIQISNDEENWETIYKVGNGSVPQETEAEETESQVMTVTKSKVKDSNVKNDSDDGTYKKQSTLNWTAIDGAAYYYVYRDGTEKAVAPDGWPFNNDTWGDRTWTDVWVPDGEHTYKVVAYDANNQEIASASITIDSEKDAEETTTEAPTEEGGETQPPVNPLDQTVEFDQQYKARYVRLYMTEKAEPAYGYHLFEFEVMGLNGLTKPPVNYGENLALNKPVEVSSLSDVWWLYHDGVKDETSVKGSNAVDGSVDTSWASDSKDNQWMYVDLEDTYDIGRVVLKWEKDAGKVYDIQTSADAKSWKTVYRKQDGIKNDSIDVPLYAAGVRYIRVYAYARTTISSGISVRELEVYEYKAGDDKKTYTIEEIPGRTTKSMKTGSYVGQDPTIEAALLPRYIDSDNIKLPIASNDWWQSAMITQFGNTMCTLPFKTGYSKKGLSVLTVTSGWVPDLKPTDVNFSVHTEETPDFYILPENTDGTTAYDRVHNYSDYAAELQLCDETGVQMTSTHVKGSPYIYCEFPEGKENVYITSQNLEGIFDDNGNDILADGTKIITDHIGITVKNKDNPKKEDGTLNYYCISLPANTTIKNNGGKLKITFSGSDKYMSVGTMLNKSDLSTYYQHGYAFVTDTAVTYAYNTSMSKIVSKYDVTTTLKRTGFSDTTMQLMLPHQWRISEQNSTDTIYTSVRGDLHGIWNNHFETTDVFEGILPEFAMPKSEEFDQNKVMEYLTALVSETSNITPAADAYWEGKNLHPLAMGVLMADQLGETEMRDIFIERLKARLVDWFNYDGEGDVSFFVYDNSWGTLYYGQSEFGANWGICDHHFTYGYFVFSAAVLATYDDEFYNDYKDMIDMLIRDYANPSDTDSEYCKFRAYDLYEGHSWAGGYADNNNGNNQESASESLFSWVGMYLWGIRSGNDSYRDAGVFGLKNEMEAIKEYWFDYHNENWLEDWPYEVVAQVYGGENFFGTFFGGQPLYCYGIQWLPLSEYLTYYGMNQTRAAEIYQGLEDDTVTSKAKAEIASNNKIDEANQKIEDKEKEIAETEEELKAEDITDAKKSELEQKIAQAKIEIATAEKTIKDETKALDDLKDYASPDNGWQHITWTFLSQTDADRALEKFNTDPSKVQGADRANTYWFMNSMKEVGQKTEDIIATGDCSATVYCKTAEDGTKKYTAMVWNPASETKTVTFIKPDGTEVATATIEPKALISFGIDPEKKVELTQVAAPTMKATDLSSGTVTDNLTGTKTFDDTQMIELSCTDTDATIYYTTDGTAPTTNSTKYEGGKILVSSDTTVKAIAVKGGYIDSTYASATIKVEGDVIQNSENLALNKTATASTENGGEKAANAVDGSATSRWQANNETAKADDWIQVDLGDVYAVNTVKLNWETAYASKYQIQVSTDGENWETVATQNGQKGEVTTTFAAAKARYVRMQGVSMATNYGYSLFEFEVYGAKQPNAPTISPVSGTYDTYQEVTMSTTVKGAEIKYTLDGTEPTENSATYTEPFMVDKSTRIKAVTYRKGMILSDVTQADIVIAGTIALNKTEANVAVGNKVQLSAITDETVIWKSSDDGIAKVDENGLVTGVAVGEVTITATLPDGESAICKVTVTEAIHIVSIALSETTLEMRQKTSKTLKLTINPENTTDDTTVIWKSSNENVVEVSNNGTLTSRGLGTATISATVGSFTVTCEVEVVKTPMNEIVANKFYNLALDKPATAYPGLFEGNITNVTDGDIINGHAATSQNTKGTYYDIDLGAIYDASAIDKIVSVYVKSNEIVTPDTGYEIQYSVTGLDDYRTIKAVDGSSAKEAWLENDLIDEQEVSAEGAVRYVRIFYPDAYAYGIQVREIAVLSTKKTAEIVEPEYGEENITGFKASSDNLGEITYTITEGDKTGYKYLVYLDGERIAGPIDAGTYTVAGVAAGEHEIKAVSYYDKKISEGIVQTVTVEDGTSYVDTDRNLAKGCNITVDAIESRTEDENGKPSYDAGNRAEDPKVLVDGKITKTDSECVKTTWGNQNATITLDLGTAYPKDMIDEVLIAFKANNTNATAYTVEFSENGTDYEKVIDVTKAEYKDAYEDKFDASNYNQETVRYVKITFTEGNANWGYQLSEVAVISKPVTYNVTVDENVVATVGEGKEYTLPSEAGIGYFDGTDMYKAGSTITVDKDMAFTTVNKEDIAVGISTGASMRLSNILETTGLRFKGTVTSTVEGLLDSSAIETGMLIASNDEYLNNDNTLNLDSTYNKANLENTGWFNNQTGTYYGAIVNIALANYNRAYIARAYVKVQYQDGSASEPIYSEMSGARSAQTVAQAILKSDNMNKYEPYRNMLETFAKETN